MTAVHPTTLFDLSAYRHKEIFENCLYAWEALGRLSDYLHTLSLGNIEIPIPDGAFLVNPELISIGKGSVVEPGAYIKGPCWIGENCTVRHGAYIRGEIITGNGCVLGHDSEFKHSILLDDAHAAHFAYVGDSILGNRINLGAGTVCANLKLDKKPVRVSIDGENYQTGLRKLGALIGDDAQTGCHAVLNPGTVLGKRAICYPCLNIGGTIPAGKVIKSAV
jgi:UDP-N-acetylglucosamine diphosphorylase / glucose-1-phosphate thymidylyltransferase / UDP-N-acetylgalactosamine diphosphorylase / glucosamine-1-phosphate N-acetyltransferase / galactosamine-1-phosphate N-acetyltransferase